MSLSEKYIEERDGTFYLQGHRIQLRTIIAHWSNGEDPESIQRSFDSLMLAEIYGAITYYLERREDLNQHFVQMQAQEDAFFAEKHASPSPFMQELHRRFAATEAHKQASAS